MVVEKANFALLALCLVGCAPEQASGPPVVYSVISNDAASNVLVLEAVDHAARKRIRYSVVCDFYRWGNREADKGPTACDLSVGDEIAPNPFQTRAGGFLDVWVRQDVLSITKGSGSEQVIEQFSIKSAKVVPYADGI